MDAFFLVFHNSASSETASHRAFSLYFSILRQSAVGKHKFYL